jgi:hypothetical protein
MVVFSEIRFNDIPEDEIYDYNVSKTISDNLSASSFEATVDNFVGKNKDYFTLNDEVTVYADNRMIQPSGNPTYQWTFNSSGTFIYDTISNRIGSCISGVQFTSAGKIGSAITLGSPAYIAISGIGSYGPGYPVSFTAWAKSPSGGVAGATMVIIGTRNAGNDLWKLGQGLGSFQFAYDSVGAGGSVMRGNVLDTNWHHYAGVYNGSNIYGYFDGVLIGSSNQVLTAGVAPADAQIGKRSDANNEYWYGQIDDLRIYEGRALTANEVAAIANKGSGTELYNNGSQLLFRGILEDISYVGQPLDEKIHLSGRDYIARLQDRTVEPEVYTNWEVGSIVQDIISKYTQNISWSGIQHPGTILPRITFKHVPVYDAIKELAGLADGNEYIFYIDNNKDFHFEPNSSVSSGYTFDNNAVSTSDFTEKRDNIFNQIWVYGDRYLDGYKETFTAGSPLGGSIFTLLYKPHNTEITVSGATIQPGGVYQMSYSTPSGLKYLVNYDDKQIIFISGTSLGAFIPSSGNQVIVNYKRLLPIVKVADDEVSKAQYGTRVKVIVDKNIKDPNTAVSVMQQQLAKYSVPEKEGNLNLQGIYNVTPGQTVVVDMPYESIDNETYDIIEASYQFNKENNLTENVMNVKLNTKMNDVTDIIKQLTLDVKKLQAADIDDSDIITRFQNTTGSVGIRQSGVEVYTRNIAGTSLILDSQVFGLLDTYTVSVESGLAFVMGNVLQGILGTSRLGGAFGAWTLIYSGGYF